MDRIRVKETLVLDSGRRFQEKHEFWGHFNYVSSFRRDHRGSPIELPLVIICANDGVWLLRKEYFELIK